MSSLVSDFIITPVLRQARRFSSGFATEETPATPQHHRARSVSIPTSASENVIFEDEVIGEISASHAASIAPERAQPSSPLPPPAIQQPATVIPADSPSQDRLWSVPEAAVADDDERPVPAAKGTPLPENDGMGDLRRRIRVVQEMNISQHLKAQLMHQLLMEKYTRAQQISGVTRAVFRPESPTSKSLQDHQAPSEPIGPLQVLKLWNPRASDSALISLPVSEEDRKPTYAPPRKHIDGFGVVQVEEEAEDQRQLGCEHYRRNVKLQCAACDKWYTCRICHDNAEDHILPRQQTKHMLCMLCGCPQRASDTCVKCGETAANYYCGICKLWNNDTNKSIYHCADCGLCRVGQGLGKDFFHCKKCMACVSITNEHKCIERSIDCDCPICGDYMFTSLKTVVFMQCGHSIHRHCFEEHMKSSYRCPICSKSCVNMETQFRSFDLAILAQPMPAEYCDARAIISCNDCSAKSQTKYHWLGLKCSLCNSYNTIQRRLINMPGGSNEEAQQADSAMEAAHPMLDQAALALILREQADAIEAQRIQDREESDFVAFERMAMRAAAQGGDFLLSRLLPRRLRSPEPDPESVPERTGSSSPPAVRMPRLAGEIDSDEEAEEDTLLDWFWGRNPDGGNADRARSPTWFSGLGIGNREEEADGDEDGEESSSEEEVDEEEEEEEEEEDENEIVLLGHR